MVGPECSDVTSDTAGRWIVFNIKNGAEECILEADRRLSEHVKKADIYGKVPLE